MLRVTASSTCLPAAKNTVSCASQAVDESFAGTTEVDKQILMTFSRFLKTAALSLDEGLVSTSFWPCQRQGTLLSFLIHGLFASEEEARCGLLDPQQGFTVAMLREFLAYFTRAGYRFL